MSSIKETAGFGAACLRLHLALPGGFEQVDVVLCEDGKTVALTAYGSGEDESAMAHFTLDEATTEDQFDEERFKLAFPCNR